MSGRTLGVDPGASAGGWAVLDELGQIVAAGDLPVVGSGTKMIISGPLLAEIVLRYAPSRAVVERVGPMPKQGVSSTFKFGRGVGLVEGVLGGALVPISYVSPVTWKRHFQVGAEKEEARQKAIQLWPAHAAELFSRKRDHGRAEAALIALWGHRAAIAAGGGQLIRRRTETSRC
jgi:crossover junction endodeoxyribonuclease RuvC